MAGVEYTFKLTATYPGQNPGESTVKVAISTPPRGGKIAVTPETGDELETAFTFTAPNWNGDGVLHYTYVAEDEEGVTTIKPKTGPKAHDKKTQKNKTPNNAPRTCEIAPWRALGRILEPPGLLQASWSALGDLLERPWRPLGSLLEASGAENKCT